MKNTLVCCFMLLLTLPVWAGWQHSVTNYSRHTYKAASQNWMTTQCANGWMYFANNKGLLEFDGSNWAVYPIHNAKMRAVKFGNDGRIYVGGLQQFGYFVPNGLGQLDYICLSDSIERRYVGNIWNIHNLGERIYFQSDHRMLYFEKDRIHRVECRDMHYSTLIDGQLYAAAQGLFVLKNDSLIRLPNTEKMVNNLTERCVGLYSIHNKLLVVGTHEVFFYDKGEKVPFDIAFNEELKGKHIFCSAFNGKVLSLGTVQDGVLLLDLETRETGHISTHNGLQNKTILSQYFDREGNLWLGLDNGITCIHAYPSILRSCVGIGSGYTSSLYQGKLYLGTNQGIFTTEYPLPAYREHPTVPLKETSGQIYSMTQHDDKLFCTGVTGLWVVDGNNCYKLPGIRGVWQVKTLSNPNQMIAATYIGMYIIEKQSNGKWQVNGRVKGQEGKFSAKTLAIEPATDALWMANKEDGVHRAIYSQEQNIILQQKCYNNSLLPKGNNVCVCPIDGQMVVASREGLFYYNPQRDTLEHAERWENLMDGCTSYTYLKQDKQRNIWYVANGALKLLRYDNLKGEYYRHKNEVFMKDALIEDFEHVCTLSDEEVLIGGEEGFYMLNLKQTQTQKYPLNLQVRHVYLKGMKDSLVYGHSYLPNPKTLKIPYRHNSIRIDYGTNNYDPSTSLYYSCKLEGPVSDTWSQAGENTAKEYTALPEGNYTFYVRTDAGGEEPLIAKLKFEILPPWYRTWWSNLIYFLLAGIAIYLFYQRLTKSSKQLVIQKEQELLRQQEAYEQESSLKDQRIGLLEEENLQAELRHKSEELVRTTLNIVRKNEILQEIKKEVMDLSHAINENNLVSLRRKTLRLIGQIDTNIEHDNDLQAFQSTFDSVHHDFFRRLEEMHPELNNKEKLLCAYIKMNLLSKEIAPLMNISLRGVEISRYRLRKKLGLEEGTNLAEYLQKFGAIKNVP